MQVLLLLLLPLVLLIVRRATPPIKARLSTLKSGIARARKPVIIKDFATAHHHHLLVRGSRMPSASPSAIITGRRYHNIISAPSGELWRTLRHNLTAGVVHPTHLHRYAAARRQALRGLVADLREQQLSNGVALAAAESIRDAVFGLASTMCFGYGVDAGVVRAMADVQTKLILSLPALRTFAAGPLTFPAVSRLIYRKRWSKLAGIRQKQEELYLPLIDGCRRHRRDSDETPSYVHTLLDLHVPVELEADDHNSGGKQRQQRRLEDGELVGLCSEFLGSATETTVASLQWIMANLIKRPGIQKAVRREIEAAVDADAEGVGEEVLGKLNYLNAVILEALRLHPTTARAFRQVRAPLQ